MRRAHVREIEGRERDRRGGQWSLCFLQIKDGVALCRFLHWLEENVSHSSSRTMTTTKEKQEREELITEFRFPHRTSSVNVQLPTNWNHSDGVTSAKWNEMKTQVFAFREQNNYLDDSFETISASGPNGAIIHYRSSLLRSTDQRLPFSSFHCRANIDSQRNLSTRELYLVDSGGQYKWGVLLLFINPQ